MLLLLDEWTEYETSVPTASTDRDSHSTGEDSTRKWLEL
jgi:hypothetical protein